MTTETEIKKKKETPALSVAFRILLCAIVLLLAFWFGFTFTVKEGSCAIVLRFGAPRSEVTDAGLHMRLPWPFESIVSYDARLQYLESNFLETTTKDKRNVILQSYVVWQIDNPLIYHNSVGSGGNIESYIKDQVFSATNSVLGSYELSALVSLEKETLRNDEIQDTIFGIVRDKCLASYGVKIADVSTLRLSLPDTNLQSVFDQMEADRQKDIDTILANAERDANKITSDADAEAARIIAEGTTAAAEIKAKAEKEVAGIYAAAQQANLELYTFLRELDTVAASVGESTVLIVNTKDYPFSILSGYSDMLSGDTDAGNNTVIKDLGYILSKMNDTDRKALTDAIYALIAASPAAVETKPAE